MTQVPRPASGDTEQRIKPHLASIRKIQHTDDLYGAQVQHEENLLGCLSNAEWEIHWATVG